MRMKKILGVVAALAMIMATTSTAFAATPVYEYNFDGSLGGAQTAVRVGDTDGLPTGGVFTVPTVDASVAAQYTEGVNGQAVFLDGSYGLILDAAPVGDTYTIAFWLKPERFSNYSTFLQIGEDLLGTEGKTNWISLTKTDWVGDATPIIWSRSQTASKELGLADDAVFPWYQKAYFAVDETTPMMLEKQAWTHVAITVDPAKTGMDPVLGTEVAGTIHSQLYINGKLAGEGPVAKYTFGGDTKVYVGCNAWDYFAKAAYDDIKIYNTVLTADEVVEAMDAASGDAAAPAASVPKTGVGSSALIFAVGTIVTGALALKRKEK